MNAMATVGDEKTVLGVLRGTLPVKSLYLALVRAWQCC